MARWILPVGHGGEGGHRSHGVPLPGCWIHTHGCRLSVYSVFGVVFVAGNLASSASDRLGRERVYIPAACLALVGALLLFVIDDAAGRWMAYAFAVVFGFGMGVMPPVLFAAVADLFHGKSYGAIQGMVVLGFSAGGAVSPWLAGYLHDMTGTYESTLFILAGSIVTCALFLWLAAPRKLNLVRQTGQASD
ncbi:MFS transporter [Chloroflexota bacterium]